MSLVLKISPALQARGLDVKHMERKTGLTMKQLEGIEQGIYKAYRLSTIEALCEAIGCEPGELFVRQD